MQVATIAGTRCGMDETACCSSFDAWVIGRQRWDAGGDDRWDATGVGDGNQWEAISKGRDNLSTALLGGSHWGATFECRGNDRRDAS